MDPLISVGQTWCCDATAHLYVVEDVAGGVEGGRVELGRLESANLSNDLPWYIFRSTEALLAHFELVTT